MQRIFWVTCTCNKSFSVDYAIRQLPLLPGRYLVSAAVYDEDLITALDHRDRVRPFVVVEGGTAERFGVIELDAGWRRAADAAQGAS